MIILLIQIAAMFLIPLLILRRRDRGLTKQLGTVAMSYLWGIAVGLLIWLANRCGLDIRLNADVGQIGSYACIGFAVPLLMFSTDLRELRRLSKKVLTAFALLALSVSVAVVLIGRSPLADFSGGRKIAAMAAGMYTGGSPNFNAIGVILRADAQTIAWGNLSDMIVGSLFYLFILTAAKPLLARLHDRRAVRDAYLEAPGEAANVDTVAWHGFHRGLVRNLLLSFGCVAIGGVIGFVMWKVSGGALTDHLVPAVMISGTVLGLALSFVPKVRCVKENSAAGNYLILVFSFALASSLDLSLIDRGFLRIMLLLCVITVLSFALHALLCRFFRIDADCVIVTMTAGLYGPAFIPAVTRQLKNDRLTAPGLICGALGYAIGTILGTALYYLL